jgi:hypothetical protein
MQPSQLIKYPNLEPKPPITPRTHKFKLYFIRRTSGQCLGTFKTLILFLTPHLGSVSHCPPPQILNSLSLPKLAAQPAALLFTAVMKMEAAGCFFYVIINADRLCGLVVRVLGYRSGGPGSIPGTTRKKNVVGLERGPLSLVSTNWGATW